ncbi:MAG: prepilin-type N-terminal cleavage/methylation domain-containing protein [Deltaproteobacteria bacterium]|nr:prepilin-type N-terminal cleavage/methylation domain-containing protein [Deltaproteobacteria bacterium]
MRAEKGFTLIELLVVIAIIGILAAIAIPQFAAYRRRAYESDVKANLKNAATAQEAYFVDFNTYLNSILASGTPPGYNMSVDVTMTSAGTSGTFLLTGTHANCASVSWTYASLNGAINSPANGCP